MTTTGGDICPEEVNGFYLMMMMNQRRNFKCKNSCMHAENRSYVDVVDPHFFLLNIKLSINKYEWLETGATGIINVQSTSKTYPSSLHLTHSIHLKCLQTPNA